jgi:hypothetical protein
LPKWAIGDRALEVIQATENAYYLLTGAREQAQVFKISQQLADALLKEAEGRHRAGMATNWTCCRRKWHRECETQSPAGGSRPKD